MRGITIMSTLYLRNALVSLGCLLMQGCTSPLQNNVTQNSAPTVQAETVPEQPAEVFSETCQLKQYNETQICSNVSLEDLIVSGNLEALKKNPPSLYRINGYLPYTPYTSLGLAAKSGHLDIVKYLVEQGANPNEIAEKHFVLPHGINTGIIFNVEKFNALIWAAWHGHKDIVSYLVDLGVDPHYTTSFYKTTALIAAAYRGHLPVVKYFLEEKKANINQLDWHGNTVFMHAAMSGNLELLAYLHDTYAVNPGQKSDQGATALNWANMDGNPHVIAYLETLLETAEEKPDASRMLGVFRLP